MGIVKWAAHIMNRTCVLVFTCIRVVKWFLDHRGSKCDFHAVVVVAIPPPRWQGSPRTLGKWKIRARILSADAESWSFVALPLSVFVAGGWGFVALPHPILGARVWAS